MFLLHRLHRRWFVLGLCTLATLALSGCVPVTWLPDSSGFVYVSLPQGKKPGEPGAGQLIHFDINKNAGRVVVDNLDADTMWPAVSPDGKRIAVARFKGQPQQAKTVQISIYDFNGKQLQQSKDVAWSAKMDPKSGGLEHPAMLFWSPKNDMLVVSDFNTTGFFHEKTQMLKVIDQAIPVIHNGTPIRPDGTGCLLLLENKQDEKHPLLAFVEWDGKQHLLDTAALRSLEKKDDKGKETIGLVGMLMLLPIVFPSGWDGNTAWIGTKRNQMTYQLDTINKTTVVSDALKKQVQDDKKGNQELIQHDFAGDVSVRLVQFVEDMPGKGKKTFYRVVAFNYQTKKETVLFPKISDESVSGQMSPNGQYLSLSFEAADLPTEMIAVINQKGELVSKIEQRK
jgi:hypothetical protein